MGGWQMAGCLESLFHSAICPFLPSAIHPSGIDGRLRTGRSSVAVVIDLSGRAALVTGASQGIGAEIARTLHRAGARVVINHPDLGDGQTRADADALAAELTA